MHSWTVLERCNVTTQGCQLKQRSTFMLQISDVKFQICNSRGISGQISEEPVEIQRDSVTDTWHQPHHLLPAKVKYHIFY